MMNKKQIILNYFFCESIVILVSGYLIYGLYSQVLNERTGVESYAIGLIFIISLIIILGILIRIIVELLKK